MKEFKLTIAVPSKEYWAKAFGLSLCSLIGRLAVTDIPGYDSKQFHIQCTEDSILPRSRQHLVEDAIRREDTHILFIDTDQSFPPDTAHRLAAWRERVVACNIAVKRVPSSPTARDRAIHDRAGRPQYVVPGECGLVKTWRVGTGVMLVDLSVFEGMPKPWFNITWREDDQSFEGEDWFFCKRLQDRGIPIYYDNDLSEQIGHWGPFEFTHKHVPIPKKYRFEGYRYAVDKQEAGDRYADRSRGEIQYRDTPECGKGVRSGGQEEEWVHEAFEEGSGAPEAHPREHDGRADLQIK